MECNLSNRGGGANLKGRAFTFLNVQGIICLRPGLIRKMQELQPPDSLHFQAAQGWLELGNPHEAKAEVEKIAPGLRLHPEVLALRWQAHAAAQEWEEALETASALIHVLPEHQAGWVHRSYSLHELERTCEARDNLLRVVDQFPDDVVIRYDLACYECQLGRLDHARRWLDRAFAIGDKEELKLMALDDPDLAPLRNIIDAG